MQRPAPRSPHACDRCARLKKKCSGDKPCEKCRRAGSDVAAACTFSPHSYGDDPPAVIPRPSPYTGGHYGAQYRDIAPHQSSATTYLSGRDEQSTYGQGHRNPERSGEGSQSSAPYPSNYPISTAPIPPTPSTSSTTYNSVGQYNPQYPSQRQQGDYSTSQYDTGTFAGSGQYSQQSASSYYDSHQQTFGSQASGQHENSSAGPFPPGMSATYTQTYPTYPYSSTQSYPPSSDSRGGHDPSGEGR